MWELLELAAEAKHHHWPAAGGLNDQAAVFVETARFIWSQERTHTLARQAPTRLSDDEEF